MAAKGKGGMMPHMIVEWGQVDSGLNAVRGALQGIAGKQTIREMSPRVRQAAVQEFGRRADMRSVARASSIAHAYEWGQAGTPAGRLWYVTPSAAGDTMVFGFRDSQKPVPLGGTEATDKEQRADHERAIHKWKRKASDLEYNTSWVVTAGDPNPETLVSPSPGPKKRGHTKFLLIYVNGETLFRKRWRNYSEYTGHFTTFFEEFWEYTAPRIIEQEMTSGFAREVRPYIERAIKTEIAGKGKIGLAAAPVGAITMLSNGKPIGARGIGTIPNQKVERGTRKRVKEIFRKKRR